MRLKYVIIFIILVFCTLYGCNRSLDRNKKLTVFFDNNEPIHHIGSDSEVMGIGTYDSIGPYHVDFSNNVYITNILNFSVDKYDKNGNYLCSIGGTKHDAVKYPGWIDIFTVNSKQNLVAYSTIKRILIVFSENGQECRTIDADLIIQKMTVKRIAVDFLDNLYFLGRIKNKGFAVVRFDLEKKTSTIIHYDNKRMRLASKELLPDFAFDVKNNILITDTIDYKVYRYNLNGRLLDTFSRSFGKNRIQEKDFNVFIRPGKIEKIPGYKKVWKSLKGDSRYFPAIFGINIDEKRLYLWTSIQDEEKKFLVDIYDLSFNYLCTTSYYNSLGYNAVIIKNRKLYCPNIGSDSSEIKNSIGCLGIFNTPHRIDIFQVSKKIFN